MVFFYSTSASQTPFREKVVNQDSLFIFFSPNLVHLFFPSVKSPSRHFNQVATITHVQCHSFPRARRVEPAAKPTQFMMPLALYLL